MRKEKLTSLIHNIILIMAVIFAYIWVSDPYLSQYSTQIFALSAIGYFIIKHLKKVKKWSVFSKNYSYETGLMTFATLILTASTGNTESIFYALSYINIFLLTMTSKTKTAITTTMAIIIFQYAVSPTTEIHSLASIMTIPIMLLFFLFTKKQYEDGRIDRFIIKKDEAEIENLSNQEQTLESFITTFLEPKLESLEGIIFENNEVAKNQISLMISESKKILEKIRR